MMKMEEVKHVWSTLRSVTKSTSNQSNSNASNGVSSTAVWYDVPTPVIIHCHEFREGKIERDEVKVSSTEVANAIDQDRIYENNAEVVLDVLDVLDDSQKDKEEELSEEVEYRRHSEGEVMPAALKKHRNTVELTAIASVQTDNEGIPTISFSFLQHDEKLRKTDGKVEVTGNEEPRQDELYDFPKNSYIDETESEKVVESSQEDANNKEISDQVHHQMPPDSPAELENSKDSSKDTTDDSTRCSEINNLEQSTAYSKVDFTSVKNRRNRGKRSVRSLKSGRRSFGMSESEGYDPGIASMSGSYSDPECPSEGRTSTSPPGGHIKFEKRRFGKAWSKMRTWIRDETTKINEVVSKHAKLQAVGALSGETERISKSKCGSYDLTKARTQELGSITRVEEFGLSCVSEEDAEVALTNVNQEENGLPGESTHPRRKTAKTDSVFNLEARSRLPPVSFSMDRLCSDTENEELDAATSESREQTSRKPRLIKRRMLGSIRGLMASTHLLHSHETEEGGQSGFEDVRRYVKQGGDFCKELAAIIHERAELEATYAKGLSKLSNKLTKACAKDQGGNSNGGVNEAWRCVGEEMEAAAEAHRVWGIALTEQLAKPLRVGVAEAQGRSRKTIENSVDKAAKSLHEWRGVAAKSKKQSFACARENERLQDLARLQTISQTQQSNNKSSNHHLTDKEANKLETRRRKAEDSSRRADTEFYTVSVRAERARLEYESTVRKGAKQMELLEEERLSALKDLANVYLAHLQALAPRLQQSADRLSAPIRNCNVSQDVEILKNLIRRIDSNDASNVEQLLPDFYAEHVTLAMNRERRKQSLVRVLHLIRQDLDRERRGREGLETLHRAFIKTPAFAADESTQNVTDKLHHMRSMLLYLEAARYKVGGTLAEVEGSKRGKHPLAEHILVSRDKQGLQQSVLKIPSWAKNESFEIPEAEDEIDEHLGKDQDTESRHWADRTAGDGNSENPPDEDDFSDFDEFSSHSEDNNNQDLDAAETASKTERAEQCRAIYQYSANLNDELSLNPGDLITVHQKQSDGWWIGECRGRTGIFPATYVQGIRLSMNCVQTDNSMELLGLWMPLSGFTFYWIVIMVQRRNECLLPWFHKPRPEQ